MRLTPGSADFQQQLATLEKIARDVAAPNAADVDSRSRFPQETLGTLKQGRLLAAPIPQDLGGLGCGVTELAELCATLAKGCGSSAMVLAMHYVQVACLLRHAGDAERFRSYLRELAQHQYLLASMTSEDGTFGEMRTSICAVRRGNGRFTLEKEATTGSYCAQADGILTTARRGRGGHRSGASTGQSWRLSTDTNRHLDAMGMRGTCSPGFRLAANGPEAQIVPQTFADIAAQTMVPYSHVLWVWWGIAADAVARAADLVRGSARRHPGTVPSNAAPLAQVSAELQAMRHNWVAIAADPGELETLGMAGRRELNSIGWVLKLNHLKIGASEAAPRIVHQALQVTGILGYKNDTPYSLGRHYRDVLSASLMISNARIAAKNASMLLVFKEN